MPWAGPEGNPPKETDPLAKPVWHRRSGHEGKTAKRQGGTSMTENELSAIIVDAAIEVHRELGGPGLLEDVYEEALEEELRLRGMLVERQLPVPIVYKGRVLRRPLRLDMKVEKLVLVDNKAVTEWNPIFEAQ